MQCGHGFALNENGRCTGKLKRFVKKLTTLSLCPCLKWRHQVSFLPSTLPQIKMSVPSSPLCAPLTALSAATPMAAISAVPKRDATRALSPTMMGQLVWVSGPGRVRVDLAGLPRSGEQSKHCREQDALSCLNYSVFGIKEVLTFLWLCPLSAPSLTWLTPSCEWSFFSAKKMHM